MESFTFHSWPMVQYTFLVRAIYCETLYKIHVLKGLLINFLVDEPTYSNVITAVDRSFILPRLRFLIIVQFSDAESRLRRPAQNRTVRVY
jgi:hypothetical protein